MHNDKIFLVAKLTGKQIRDLARSLVLASPSGIRYTPVVKQIHEEHPETPQNTNDVNAAVSLGGAAMKSKWGTPDVVGDYKPTAANLIKFDIEIGNGRDQARSTGTSCSVWTSSRL